MRNATIENPEYLVAAGSEERGRLGAIAHQDVFPSWLPMIFGTGGGVRVTDENLLSSSAVFACVRNISEDIATLPLILYRRLPRGGKERATEEPLYAILHDEPNDEMTSSGARQAIVASAVLFGNGYAEIERRGDGQVVALWPIEHYRVTPMRDGNRRLFYRVWNEDGSVSDLPAADMLHLAGFTMNGVFGEMVARLGRESFGLYLAAERYAAAFFGNGATHSGVFEHPQTMSEGAQKRFRETYNQLFRGSSNAFKVLITEEGMKFNKMTASPEEGQNLETRQFQVSDVARWFRMPPHMIGDLTRSTNNNIEHQGIEYVTYGIRPKCVMFEQEIRRKLIPPTRRAELFAEHLMDALLRGDTATRTAARVQQVLNGGITLNEWRVSENLNPLPGELGDQHFMPVNITTVEKAVSGPVTPPPADVPPPVDDAAEDETEARVARLAAAHRMIFTETFARLMRIESDKLTRGAKRPSFDRAAFFADHAMHVRNSLIPGIEALTAAVGAMLGEDVADETRLSMSAAETEIHIAASEAGDAEFDHARAERQAAETCDRIINRIRGKNHE